MESFLKEDGEKEIVIPRHRSPLFYLVIMLLIAVSLVLLTGAGYLVYRAAWGENKNERKVNNIEDNTLEYKNTDIGFSIFYPDNWTLEEGYPKEKELLSLRLYVSSKKELEIRSYQLDPVVAIGGLEAIKEYLSEDVSSRIRSLGGVPSESNATGAASGQTGNPTGQPSQQNPTEQGVEGEGTGEANDLFTSIKVGDFPAFYKEFNVNILGEETRFIFYYLVAYDYIFVFQGQSPADGYKIYAPN